MRVYLSGPMSGIADNNFPAGALAGCAATHAPARGRSLS